MASRFLQGTATAGANNVSNNWVQLRATSVATTSGDNNLIMLRIYCATTFIIQLDSDATGSNTTTGSTITTAIPAAGQWVELGPIDPSRVWIRSGTTSTMTVYWNVSWM